MGQCGNENRYEPEPTGLYYLLSQSYVIQQEIEGTALEQELLSASDLLTLTANTAGPPKVMGPPFGPAWADRRNLLRPGL